MTQEPLGRNDNPDPPEHHGDSSPPTTPAPDGNGKAEHDGRPTSTEPADTTLADAGSAQDAQDPPADRRHTGARTAEDTAAQDRWDTNGGAAGLADAESAKADDAEDRWDTNGGAAGLADAESAKGEDAVAEDRWDTNGGAAGLADADNELADADNEVETADTWYRGSEADGEGEPGEAESGKAENGEPEDEAAEGGDGESAGPVKKRRVSGAGITIALLLGALGFSLVVQVKSNSTDAAFASQREADLIQIMSDLDSAERRLNQDIESLEDARRDLQSGQSNQAAAQAEARKRADALGILAGTLEATGPGVEVQIVAGTEPVNANDLLTVVQLLRIGDAEAIQINGNEAQVRVVAGTSFVDADGAVRVDGVRLTGPYTLLAIGEPGLLKGAVEFAGGVVTRLSSSGGKLIVELKDPVEIKAIRTTSALQYAEPVS